MTDIPPVTNAAARRAPRRSREELENLAQEFAASAQGQASNRGVVIALGTVAVVLAAVLAWLQWPREEPVHERAASESAAADASAQWRQHLEAERERHRRALKTSGDYLARSAASDAALLADFTRGADRLAKLADAAPSRPGAKAAPAAAAPTPRKDEPAKGAEVASATPVPASRQAAQPAASAPSTEPAPKAAARSAAEPPAKQEVATAAPAQTEPAPAAPAAVAPAGPGECRIYVSELSSSGKLTYADVTRMKGARVDGRTQHVFTPPVQVSGRTIVFDVAPNGCVEVARSTFSR